MFSSVFSRFSACRSSLVKLLTVCDCQATYIGETGRNLNVRLTEHKRATRNGDINNHITEHHLKPLTTESTGTLLNAFPTVRTTIRSWFTNLEQTPLNRCQQLPAPYKRLIANNNKTEKQ